MSRWWSIARATTAQPDREFLTRAAVALGSNLGDRAGLLARARAAIGGLAATRVVAASPVEETAPVGPVLQGAYLNQMLLVETVLEPRALLEALSERTASAILALDGVERVRVAARKPHAPIPGPLDYVEVVVDRTRSDRTT